MTLLTFSAEGVDTAVETGKTERGTCSLLLTNQVESSVNSSFTVLQTDDIIEETESGRARFCINEPIWAIGTGKTATAEQAAEVCTSIRTTVRHLYGARIARSITIQYGGSMKPGNAAELLAQPDIDGGLIGGASLKPADFVEIINAANQD